GEEEHGLLLYNPVMRVPLIISAPGINTGGGGIGALFATVDFFPTILDIFGWELPEGISGRSFAPGLAGGRLSDGEIYLETEFPRTEYGWSPLAGLIAGEWKYIAAPREELYNLRVDHGENVNLATTHSGTARQLKERLAKMSGEMAEREFLPAALENRERGALASLGYLGGGGGTRREQKMLRDPKDVIGLRSEFIAAVDQIHLGETAAAEAKLRDLIEKSPESYTFRFRLARLLYDLGRLEEAGDGFRTMAEMYPDEFKTHYNLGKTLNKLEQYDEAIAELQLALEIEPGQTSGHNNLGIAFLRSGLIDRAIDSFRRSIELDDRQVDPHNNLGNALLARGRIEAAAAEFARSVEIAPDFFEGRYNLGLALLELGKKREAAREFEEALRIRPGFQPAKQNLAIALGGGASNQ
ncbi:MAG: tetratricopeptide repeat protein, partial [PVC group bacterium]